MPPRFCDDFRGPFEMFTQMLYSHQLFQALGDIPDALVTDRLCKTF